MANTSKEQAVIDYLITCDSIKNSPLYFNFINAQDKNKQIITLPNEKSIDQPFVDGSIRKRYTFTIIDFRSVSYNALVMALGTTTTPQQFANENVDEFLDVQAFINWITEQNKLKNYPDFGDKCIIEEMRALTDNPNLNGVDTNVKPSLAKYSVSIQIDYIDTSEVIWNN